MRSVLAKNIMESYDLEWNGMETIARTNQQLLVDSLPTTLHG